MVHCSKVPWQLSKNLSVSTFDCLGYVSNNMPEKVLDLFEKMSLKPNEVILTIAFNACAKLADARAVTFSKDVLGQLPSAFLEDDKLVNSIIDMVMKLGDVPRAEYFFRLIKTKSLVTYGAMMKGNGQ